MNIKSQKLSEGTIILDELIRSREFGVPLSEGGFGHAIAETGIKTPWELGVQIGEGGFGCIYLAKEVGSENFDKVIKLEPYVSGGLYVEEFFYRAYALEARILEWKQKKSLDFLGLPRFIESGKFQDNRFLVMDRFGDDLRKTLKQVRLSAKCIFQISINILDVLEYMHSCDMVHADIKASNIVRGYTNPAEIYLIDFGSADRFKIKGKHLEEGKLLEQYKHLGTLAFSSRDSHRGMKRMRPRGDIDSLFYNMVFWLTWSEENKEYEVGRGRLPWLSCWDGHKATSLKVKRKVAESKKISTKDPKKFIESVGLNVYSWSKYMEKMLTTINGYSYDADPDFDQLRENIAMMISEIDGKPPSVTDNRTIVWDSEPLPHIPDLTSTDKSLIKEVTTNRKRRSNICDINNNETQKVKKIEENGTISKETTAKEDIDHKKSGAAGMKAKNGPKGGRRSHAVGKDAVHGAQPPDLIPVRKSQRRFIAPVRKSPRFTM